MLTITYCPKDKCEFTLESLKCENCEFYIHVLGYFGCDWFECNYYSPFDKEDYIELINRLSIGL